MKQKQRRGNPLLPFLPNSIFSVHIFPSLHSINQTKPNQTNSLLFSPIHPKILTTTTTIKTNNTPKAKKKGKKKRETMQQLLFTVILSEMALILVLLFKTPLRKLVIMGLDRVKRGRGPIMVKTVGATVFVVLLSSVYSMTKIRKRWIDEGAVNPTDQVLMAKHLLEATLMGNF